jgi:2-oxoglutarate dehydrogenase E1 component
LLRRQALRKWRKPLIVMSPKSLLRHPKVVSTLDECASGQFQRILPDRQVPSGPVERIILCTGKIYYELEKARGENKNAAILRFEQLYPLSDATVQEALKPYSEGTQVIWVQEEPENMGAWRFLRARFGESLFGKYPLSCVSRPASASPATGSANSHKQEQEQIIAAAFANENDEPSRGNGKENAKYVNRVESPRSRRIHH